MYPKWIINAVVCFEFRLALPEVIHLPRGLEAVTRNWRNHDSTELSASTVPRWGIWRCTLRHQEVGTFSLWVFYAVFFPPPIYFFPQYFSFTPPPDPTAYIYGSGNTFNLMIRWPENLNFAGILSLQVCEQWWRRRQRCWKNTYKFLEVRRQSRSIRSRRATTTFMAFDLKYNPRISPRMFRKTVWDEPCLMKNMVMSQKAPFMSTLRYIFLTEWQACAKCVDPGSHWVPRASSKWQRAAHADPQCPVYGGKVVATARTLGCLVALKQRDLSLFMTGARFLDR